jgi:hypothetical protein
MAVSRHLLTTQTNQVLQQIRTVGLDAQDFEWEDSDSNVRLRHVPSGSYFWFDGDLRYCYYSPGLNKRTENRQTPLGWPSQFSCVGEWLGCLRREVETPDLWGALRQERELVDASISDAEDNRPFTPAEQERIAQSLREVRDYVLKSGAYTAAQLAVLNSRLDYLESASTRVGRKDWINLAVATLTKSSSSQRFPARPRASCSAWRGRRCAGCFGGRACFPSPACSGSGRHDERHVRRVLGRYPAVLQRFSNGMESQSLDLPQDLLPSSAVDVTAGDRLTTAIQRPSSSRLKLMVRVMPNG